MASRRMFSREITDSDFFIDLPLSSQALYFHLGMTADDDGVVNNPSAIRRMIGASEDDIKLLIAKRFLIAFENGVIVIKHWKINNSIQKDRYKPSKFQKELETLTTKPNGAYTFLVSTLDTEWIQNGYKLDTQTRQGKVRQGKERTGKTTPMEKDNQSSLLDILSDADLDALHKTYVSNGTDLMDFLYSETLGSDVSLIVKPLAYARSILNEKGWAKK